MAINANHTVEEINGVRCSIIERNISDERATFIQKILQESGQKCIISESSDGLKTVGVTDLTFNLVHALYAHQLWSNKQIISPSIWYTGKENTGFYWENR
jgi:hypothetical protein